MADTATEWRSLDAAWTVHLLPGWIRGDHEGSEFFQLKWHGRLVAEVNAFAELGHWVPVHLLVREG
ncbi:hypothetical protein [Actinocatenispora comari]|jgi:hypothetical protein|uniref:Uncharacterized protein n=1 Tax=Actinocatenispora comari TaxID=2807577 RepID=A0A8J4A718_9ACTN|nr:hypothetical protein [Actinocatenispora comari]GIL25468.1 hypothetical protein NUM_07230 [Actinocatenispora comari]